MKTPLIRNALLAATIATADAFSSVTSAQAMDFCAAPCGAPPPTIHPPKPPKADPNHDKYGAAALGLLGGLMLGTVIAGSGKKASASAAELHIAWCDAKYKTYDPYTNTFMSKTGPKYCNSPYL
jgi:hypothetical protein